MTDGTVMLEIAAPDDWHVHLRRRDAHRRDPYTANVFRHAVVMPNINPPVTSTQAAASYRARVGGGWPRRSSRLHADDGAVSQ